MRKIGYARVPYTDQNLDVEITHLLINGCDLVFSEKVNIYSKNQIELKSCLEELKENDILVINDLKTLGLTPKQFMDFIDNEIISKNLHLEVLNLNINTQNEYGQYFIRVLQMLLESEKVLVQERTSNGLKAAREKGRKGGRPQKVEKSQRYYIKQLYDSDKYTGEEIAQMTGLSRSSIYRIIKEML
ncbi:recombinase family protein [Staphylococcus aureus]|uniref:recombinase family protein n=1 Tax=Staphylococcus aureus TaxID=1280 RepID=UPI0013F65286|nr:recombinase family protein [Staphylococcus aureus]NHF44046.1 recombinase family protein [Staphylococcus aureus]